jgi:hypothetical protein
MRFRALFALTLVGVWGLSTLYGIADDADRCVNATGREAMAACTRVITSGETGSRGRAVAYYSRGQGWLKTGEYDRAIADFDASISLDPASAWTFNNRGSAWYDWVVLSACNTAAADKPGAETLSGLARAFFYAGARALLVSHWSVDSEATTRLTTSTLAIMKADPKLGRAAALRNAMVAYINDRGGPLNAYPAFWAPFSIIGEGAAR